ncbi:N-acetyl-gamma-glutamyl-phosphate reductase [Holophaga foetida]|uniref:N-acetyl-gamma-glutamyl-phosphate reductase n=1 Tax=Holophaga foetida TaxID=35839 RepID=UPI0002473ED5|nr:N-acetyl-gamma-glutamyl-phosphate reductase [Holophaga foetida]
MVFDSVVIGAGGYGGGELLRLLMGHPNSGSIQAVSRSQGGKPVYTAHPGLKGFMDQAFHEAPDWAELAKSEHPVVFSAQAHGDLAQQLPDLEAAWAKAGIQDRVILVDFSGDFRLDDAGVFEKAYGKTHPCPEYFSKFVYACPEVNREAIRSAKRIANPGCFATALNLALLPLAKLEVSFVAVSAATGSSGSGVKPQSGTHHPERAQDYKAYKVLKHQHCSEVSRILADQGAKDFNFAFVPHSAPMVRGIFATVQFELPQGFDAHRLREHYQAFYKDAAFVRFAQESPRVAPVLGSNMAELAVQADGRSAVVMVAIDNLMKGMAGQALQNLNLALGLDERAGLKIAGRCP